MNLPHRRRSRARGQARLAAVADRDTEWLDQLRTDPADGTTFTGQPAVIFEGASGAGQPATGPLDRIRERGPRPETFPVLPGGPRDTGPMQRMPRLARVRQRPRPDRPYDAALFTWSGLLDQFIMLCGTCPPDRRNRYADPVAGHMPHGFEALRVSAYTSGWRLDAFARWCCKACQAGPHYRAPYAIILWDPDALEAYGTSGEREYRQAAEHDLIRDVHDTARHGRHHRTVTP